MVKNLQSLGSLSSARDANNHVGKLRFDRSSTEDGDANAQQLRSREYRRRHRISPRREIALNDNGECLAQFLDTIAEKLERVLPLGPIHRVILAPTQPLAGCTKRLRRPVRLELGQEK